MKRSQPYSYQPPLPHLPGFWQLQLIGWSTFALLSLPLKLVSFGSVAAALFVTAYQIPLALGLSGGLRWFYRRTNVYSRASVAPSLLVLAGATVAGVVDTAVSLPLNAVLAINPDNRLLVPGVFFFRAAIYVIWSLGYFLGKTLLAAREQSFLTAVNDERHRLELMRYQLNPDFLARSLSAISQEIPANPATARAMTQRLAAFYENTLRHTDHGRATTIGDELALVRTFLELESLRRRDALQVSFAVDDSLLSLPLPPVMLLPLAEQALKAGGSRGDPLHITVTIERSSATQIILEVANSGPPSPATAAARPSEVADVRASLERHYPGRHRFELRQDSFTTRATIHLPAPA